MPGETLRETLERLAKDLAAELVTQVTSEDGMIHPRPRLSSSSGTQGVKKAIA